MDGREGMPSFYRVSGSGSHAGSGQQGGGGLHVPPPGFKTQQSNPNNISPHGGHNSNIRVSSITYQLEHNISPVFPHGINMGGGGGGGGGGVGGSGGGGAMSIAAAPRSGSDPVVKKKRGRPRKYGPDGSHMALGLTPAAASVVVAASGSPGSGTPTPKKNRGRPPGSGRKQRLANVGEWMSNSAGLAFTPHIIHVAIGEDVAAKVLSFAQHRPRALCILSGNGSISAVTLRQFTSSGGTVTYEGRFEILCLSGSYLLPETGSLNNRTGGLSISVCSADGHVIGGAIGGRLIASSLVQVVVCSFVHGSNTPKGKTKTDATSLDEKSPDADANESSPQNPVAWPPDSRNEQMRNSHTEIDLTRG